MNFLSEDSITHWISPTHPEEASKKFTAIFNCNDKSGKNKDTYMSYIDFGVKDAEKVQALLKEKIGNKYIRMKKN